jgi:hypothetical protein
MPKMIHHRIEVSENPSEMRNSDLGCCWAWRDEETELFVVAGETLAAVERMRLKSGSLRANNEGQV